MVLALGIAVPAAAQFSESYKFLKAVRDADGNEVMKSLKTTSSTLINTRDYQTGETALSMVARRSSSRAMPNRIPTPRSNPSSSA